MNCRNLGTLFALLALLGQEATCEQSKLNLEGPYTDKCRVLAMSGGSNHGVWESGILWGLTHYGNPEDFQWDVVTGVSAGSLNTAMTAMFAKGDEVNMSEWMSNAWAECSSAQVWRTRPDGVVRSIWEDISILDDDPAFDYVTSLVNQFTEVKRRFIFGTVDVNTGEYLHLDHTQVSFDEIPTASLGSGSIPVVFPPRAFKGHLLMDGGTAWNINLDSGVNMCLDMGYAEEDIIVDVAIDGARHPEPQTVSKNAVQNLLNVFNLRSYYYNMNSVQSEERAVPNIEIRYWFEDHCNCPDNSQLDFNNSTTWCLQERGRQDAKDMLAIGQDNIRRTLDDWLADEELQEQTPNFRDYLRQIFGI